MLAVGSIMVVAAHSTGSSAAVVAAFAHRVLAYETTVVASGIGGAAFALAYVAGSSAVVEELVRLQEVRPNVASAELSME
jgi:hypothetical protein